MRLLQLYLSILSGEAGDDIELISEDSKPFSEFFTLTITAGNSLDQYPKNDIVYKIGVSVLSKVTLSLLTTPSVLRVWMGGRRGSRQRGWR